MADQGQQLHCPPEVARLVPESLAREFRFCPLDHVEGRFTIAVATYLTDAARDAVQIVLGDPVCEVIHPAEIIFTAINQAYGPGAQGECSVSYRREQHDIGEDGTITIRTAWYDDSGHATGWTEITPASEDHPLWNWICSHGDHLDKIISSEALDAIRAEYHQAANQAPGPRRHDEP